ncbi:hypothetical protein EJ110_NYTH44131 [Nymphaea thermarum]|nr:hypothetical protein EJ110_NYTH44131 [Nymphaea thermarum]
MVSSSSSLSSSSTSTFFGDRPLQSHPPRLLKARSSLPRSSRTCVCTIAPDRVEVEMDGVRITQRPDAFGRFGKLGGKYVPETLMYALTELESAF